MSHVPAGYCPIVYSFSADLPESIAARIKSGDLLTPQKMTPDRPVTGAVSAALSAIRAHNQVLRNLGAKEYQITGAVAADQVLLLLLQHGRHHRRGRRRDRLQRRGLRRAVLRAASIRSRPSGRVKPTGGWLAQSHRHRSRDHAQ